MRFYCIFYKSRSLLLMNKKYNFYLLLKMPIDQKRILSVNHKFRAKKIEQSKKCYHYVSTRKLHLIIFTFYQTLLLFYLTLITECSLI